MFGSFGKGVATSRGFTILAQGAPTVSPTEVITPIKLTGQTSDITLTTIYVPPAAGLFRFSLYCVVTTVDAGAGGLTGRVNWTDDSGSGQYVTLLTASLNTAPPGNFSTNSVVFEAAAGQPISYYMTGGAPYGAAAYSLYATLEQIG
jgi:hypothetical protein